jgi:hypothetical protein
VAPKVHLDPLVVGVPDRHVLERVDVEVCASCRLMTRSTFLLNSAVTPAESSYAREPGCRILDEIGAGGSSHSPASRTSRIEE